MRNCEQPVAYYKTYKHQTPDEERVCDGDRQIEDLKAKVLKNLTKNGSLLKQEGKEVEKILMRNDPDDGVQGGSTLWKLTQAITAHARELTPERSRELHEISGALLNRVKLQA